MGGWGNDNFSCMEVEWGTTDNWIRWAVEWSGNKGGVSG